MTKKIKLEHLIYVFFMFQPLVNIYRTFWGDNLKIFGFSLFEMINTFFVIGLWIYVVLKSKNKKVLYVILYFCVLGCYCVLHYFNISKFDTEIFERSIYGMIQESYYIFRVYGLPVLLIFSLLYNELEKKFFVRVASDVATLTASVIVITNVLGVSFCTYGGEDHTYLIQGTFFDWFHTTGVENMKYYTSIGWFGSGNEISGLLLMTLPVVTYQFFKCKNRNATIRFGISMLAMLMIGTKTATLGCLAVFLVIGMVRMIVRFSKRKYKKVRTEILLFLTGIVLSAGVFYYSPFLQEKHPHVKTDELSESNKKHKEEMMEEEFMNANKVALSDETPEEQEYAIEYINNNYWSHYVNKQFIDNYPAEKDVSYWVNVINRDAALNQNYRAFKKELMGRIIERNGRSLDKIVGVGVFPEINCEQDYVYQYFMFGIAGLCLIVGIYIVLFGKNAVAFLAHFKMYWNDEFMSYMCAFAIALLLPYLTGHMLGNTLIMFQIVLIAVIVEKTAKKIKLQK